MFISTILMAIIYNLRYLQIILFQHCLQIILILLPFVHCVRGARKKYHLCVESLVRYYIILYFSLHVLFVLRIITSMCIVMQSMR